MWRRPRRGTATITSAWPRPARGKLRGPEQAEWTRRLEAELDNLRAAIALALSGGVDPVIAVKFEVAMMNFRILRGYATEGRKNLRDVLALPGVMEPNIARGHALYVGGVLATSQGDYAEATTAADGMPRSSAGAWADPREIAATLSTLSVLHLREGDAAKARECEEEGLGIFRQLGDKVGEAIGLLHLGEICVQLADDANAREHFEQCLVIAQEHQAPGSWKANASAIWENWRSPRATCKPRRRGSCVRSRSAGMRRTSATRR